MPAKPLKTERVEVRLPLSQKKRLQQAARQRGQSLSDFVVQAADDLANKILLDRQTIELGRQDQIAFAKALIDPPTPNEKLSEAIGWYREETGS